MVLRPAGPWSAGPGASSKREWRQQFLILLLIVVALAAVVVGSAVAVNTPPPANAGFGTAHDLATFSLSTSAGSPAKSGTQSLAYAEAHIAALQQHFGPVQVIANETFTVPGSNQTYQLRSQDPHGPFAGPMLQLLSGHYPTGPDQIALTPGVASDSTCTSVTRGPRAARPWSGWCKKPQSLLDEFALVPPGQVTHPSQVSALFNAPPGALTGSLADSVTMSGPVNNNTFGPETIVLALATVGMLLVSRSCPSAGSPCSRSAACEPLAWSSPWGRPTATSASSSRPTVSSWESSGPCWASRWAWWRGRPTGPPTSRARGPPHLDVRPAVERDRRPAMVLAVVATFFAASFPARAITRVPVVSALAGRPAPPRQIRRSFVPAWWPWSSGSSSSPSRAPVITAAA